MSLLNFIMDERHVFLGGKLILFTNLSLSKWSAISCYLSTIVWLGMWSARFCKAFSVLNTCNYEMTGCNNWRIPNVMLSEWTCLSLAVKATSKEAWSKFHLVIVRLCYSWIINAVTVFCWHCKVINLNRKIDARKNHVHIISVSRYQKCRKYNKKYVYII